MGAPVEMTSASATAPRRWRNRRNYKSAALLSLLAASSQTAMAQSNNCISLAGSAACPAFNQSSISKDSRLTGLYPFLSFVSDTRTFDTRLRQYIATDWARQKYQQLIGCDNVDLSNTTDLYARYTASVLCNAIVQQSIDSCGLSTDQSRPLCADTCAEYAISEQQIAASPEICGSPGNNAVDQIRADFTNCALPANALSGTCIEGVQNEANDCGFNSNLGGLCSYCAASSPNSTDSCCVNSQAESRCSNVHLPSTTSMPPITFFTGTSTGRPTSTGTQAAGSSGGGSGLSGGAIAGIVIGSLLGALLLLGLIVGACILVRRRRESQAGSIFNQPSPSRAGPPMSYTGIQRAPEVTPGGRVTRMSALEGTSNSEPHSSPIAGGYHGSSDEYDDSPESQRSMGMAMMQKRDASLSSHSHVNNSSSPGNDFSSPEGVASGQSEQLQFFKDYYSQDEIRANDIVATLWAYQPRANDEFELERGDMLKVVGIWDDGWATGVRVKEKAEDWEIRRKENRDSGVSNGSKGPTVRPVSPPTTEGEIKAFPLVCVCLPQHWRKTIEGDSATEGGTNTTTNNPPPGSP